ncbi:MAG: hydrogenase nickel incorporation protein HypB [Rhodospirillales bacterium]|nr:hydrogenase nickel incorporation protein HypB [Rhodospirillales bacterium]
MCTVCGCGDPKSPAQPHDHDHDHDHGHDHSHGHEYGHGHGRGQKLDYGKGIAGAHVPGLSQARIVQIERNILAENDRYAALNRQTFKERGILALNLVSSPGAGKTTLLVRSIADLTIRCSVAVVEGDQQTSLDADRIRAAGVPAIQVNTGKGCHLDAHMVHHAMETLALPDKGVLFIENVGNLVCPAAFDLGEATKVAILSVTEGEDKPLKYPDMFRAARLMILNKIDLLPHVPFDVARCLDYAKRVNPEIGIIQLSAVTGEGLAAWYDWIDANRTLARIVG